MGRHVVRFALFALVGSCAIVSAVLLWQGHAAIGLTGTAVAFCLLFTFAPFLERTP